MKEAKRYDAVHLRYEDSNIRYGEGCEAEVVAAYDYDELKAVSRELLEALGLCLVQLEKEHMPSDEVIHAMHHARAAICKAVQSPRGES